MSSEEGTDESVQGMLAQLLVAANADDRSEAHSLTRNILTSTEGLDMPDGIYTRIQQIHCRACISLSKYSDVIEYCASLGQEERVALIVERTYALYKLGRYADCRDSILKASKNAMPKEATRGVTHLLAQCYYRLQETEKAQQIYCDLSGSPDYDEDSVILTNAMAASTANNSLPISSPLIDGLQDLIMKELEIADEKNGDDFEYPYELVSNYATHLLLISKNLAQTKQAMDLLAIAEEECKAIYEGDNGDSDKDLLKNVMPIQSNVALGKAMSGDLNGAIRSYLELVLSSKQLVAKDPTFNGGGAILAAEHNLTVLTYNRGSSSSAYDLLKKLPDISPGNNIITPNQIRIVLYNRALLYYKMGKVAEVKSVLKSLSASLSPSAQVMRQVENGKKKKGKNAGSGSEGNLVATPANDAEKMLWECRIAILENETTQVDTLEGMASSINDALKGAGKEPVGNEALEYALAELKMYQAQKTAQGSEGLNSDIERNLVSALEDLPGSIRNRPATVASLCSLYSSLGMDDKVELTLNASSDSGMAQKSLADFKLRLGMYDEAASIYDSLLNVNDSALSDEEIMECTAGLVKALSHIDIDKAMDMAEDFTIDENTDLLDGEELEAMDIPRLSKTSGSGGSRKIISSRGDGRYVLLSIHCIFYLFVQLTCVMLTIMIGNIIRNILMMQCFANVQRDVRPT